MLTPLKPCSLQFVSDGMSTSLTIDLTLQPLALVLTGVGLLSIFTPSLSDTQGAPVPIVKATVVGTVATFSFGSTALPQRDLSLQPVIYTLSFLLGITQGVASAAAQAAGYGNGGYGTSGYGL